MCSHVSLRTIHCEPPHSQYPPDTIHERFISRIKFNTNTQNPVSCIIACSTSDQVFSQAGVKFSSLLNTYEDEKWRIWLYVLYSRAKGQRVQELHVELRSSENIEGHDRMSQDKLSQDLERQPMRDVYIAISLKIKQMSQWKANENMKAYKNRPLK